MVCRKDLGVRVGVSGQWRRAETRGACRSSKMSTGAWKWSLGAKFIGPILSSFILSKSVEKTTVKVLTGLTFSPLGRSPVSSEKPHCQPEPISDYGSI